MAPRRQIAAYASVLPDREADIRVPYFNAPFVPITLAQRADVKSVRIILCIVLLMAASHVWGCASASGRISDRRHVRPRAQRAVGRLSGASQEHLGPYPDPERPARQSRSGAADRTTDGVISLRALVRRTEQGSGRCRRSTNASVRTCVRCSARWSKRSASPSHSIASSRKLTPRWRESARIKLSAPTSCGDLTRSGFPAID